MEDDERGSFHFRDVKKIHNSQDREREGNEPIGLIVAPLEVLEHLQAQLLTPCAVGTNRSYLARKLLLLTHVVGAFQ